MTGRAAAQRARSRLPVSAMAIVPVVSARKRDLYTGYATDTAKRRPDSGSRGRLGLCCREGAGTAVDEPGEGADRCRFLPGLAPLPDWSRGRVWPVPGPYGLSVVGVKREAVGPAGKEVGGASARERHRCGLGAVRDARGPLPECGPGERLGGAGGGDVLLAAVGDQRPAAAELCCQLARTIAGNRQS